MSASREAIRKAIERAKYLKEMRAYSLKVAILNPSGRHIESAEEHTFSDPIYLEKDEAKIEELLKKYK